MKRLTVALTAVVFLLLMFAPAAFAAERFEIRDEILVAVNGDVDVAAGDRVETVVVIDGNATISGEVETIVVAGGTASLSGATARTLVVWDGTADLTAGTMILGDVHTFNGTVTQQEGTVIQGSVSGFEDELAAFAILMIPLAILLFFGVALIAVVAALAVAAFAARQVRDVEELITRQPGQVLLAGIAGTVLLPLFAVLLMVTVVGAPVGLLLLLVVLPVAAFLGWLIAAIWVGDWLVARLRGDREPERPYLAAVVGVIVLAIAGVLPFVSAIATLFGFGALLLAAWRTLRGDRSPVGGTDAAQAVPSAS